MQKVKKLIYSLAVAGTVLVSSAPAFAAIEAYVTDNKGTIQEFNKDDLVKSIVENSINNPSPMYDTYREGDLVAVKDDVRGYIDVEAVRAYIIESTVNQREIDVDKFVESSDKAETIEVKVDEKLDINGEVIEKDKEEDEEVKFEVVDIN